MSEAVELRVDWCSYQAAKYAVEHWHYSGTMPRSKMLTIGVWEGGEFIGCVVFSYGATPHICSPYGLTQFEICELTRVALREHQTQVTSILRRALSLLKNKCPGIRLVVSFADTEQDHLGIIYQANNWIYNGTTKSARVGFMIKGKKVHTRTIGLMPGGIQSLEWVRGHMDNSACEWIGKPKHRYLYPLDRAMRRQIEPLRKPYPKREPCGQSVNGDTIGYQPIESGSIPDVRSELLETA